VGDAPSGVSQGAARATIQRRCADAHLHDVRGSLQALFGALELLCRVAKGSADPARAEKACELARRAMGHHEKTTLELFRLLTFQSDGIREHDLHSLVDGVAHLFRNDVAARGLSLQLIETSQTAVRADRGALHAAVAALLSVAVDSSAPASSVRLLVGDDPEAVLTLEFMPAGAAPGEDALIDAAGRLLAENGGHVDDIRAHEPPRRTLRVMLPRA